MTNKKLYEFCRCFGKHGDLDGIFIAEPDNIKKLIGTNVYFGEVLGKHSNISCVIEEKDIKELQVLDSTITDLLDVIGCTIGGYNPLDYLESDE